MSTDFSIRPVGAPVATPVPPSVGDAARNSIATQLPPTQSVTAANAGGGASSDYSQNASDFISRQAFFDTAAAAVVFQSVDSLTGEVIQQYPDAATLRRRAYFHSLDQSSDGSPRPLPTDLKA